MNTQAERNLVPFAFGENLVRSMLDEGGNPWFVAKDIARFWRFKISGRIFLNWMKMKRVYVLLTPLVDRRNDHYL